MNKNSEIVFQVNDKLRIVKENDKYYIQDYNPIWYNKNRWTKWTGCSLGLLASEFDLYFDSLIMAKYQIEQELKISIIKDSEW